MKNVLTFRVAIQDLEDKIWRVIEIHDRMTVADLAYTILATFNSLAYHLYEINHNKKTYDCWVAVEHYPEDEKLINAVTTKLSDMKLKYNDKLTMEYDQGTPTTFVITYLGSRPRESKNYGHYPVIVDGAGNGMLDDVADWKLAEIVHDTDKHGYSNYYYSPGYETTKKYDYRVYNIKTDNRKLKGLILEIKNGYEIS